MATPLAAGCAAVVREYLAKAHGVNRPSAALLKALLINGAHPLVGQYAPPEIGVIPNTDEGFGRINVKEVVAPGGSVQQVIWSQAPQGDVKIITRANRISRATQSYALVVRAG